VSKRDIDISDATGDIGVAIKNTKCCKGSLANMAALTSKTVEQLAATERRVISCMNAVAR
jgi:hypothetical protein